MTKDAVLNVAVLNGGRGAGSIIAELIRRGAAVVSIVNGFDDGKSTGAIRGIVGMIGPSDFRKVHEGMLAADHPPSSAVRSLFRYRVPAMTSRKDVVSAMDAFVRGHTAILGDVHLRDSELADALRAFLSPFLEVMKLGQQNGRVGDWSLMNCVYAGAFLYVNRDFEQALALIEGAFAIPGMVQPVNVEDKKLVAITKDGEVKYNEAAIVGEPSRSPIQQLYLHNEYPQRGTLERLPHAERRLYLEALDRIVPASPTCSNVLRAADVILYAPGTQHSSLYPTYMARSLASVISSNARALKVLVVNIAADVDTATYTAADYVDGARRYLAKGHGSSLLPRNLFTHVIVNRPTRMRADHVTCSGEDLSRIHHPVIVGDFESETAGGVHDGRKVVDIILDLQRQRTQDVAEVRDGSVRSGTTGL